MESKVIFFDDVYEHEKKGIDLLRDAIPPKRFYLLVSTKVTNRYSTREIDVTLVCPKGIFSIEMKDWSGTIRERISLNNSHLTYIARSGESRKEINPFSKAEEQRKKVAGFIKKNIHGNQELIRRVNRNGGVKGVVFFTNERLQFRLGDIGNIVSLNPENVSDLWERLYPEDLFTEQDIKTIVGIYGEGKESGGEARHFHPGEQVNGYKIEELIFDGDDYHIYRARNELLEQRYFLKAMMIDPGDREHIQDITREMAQRDARVKAVLRQEPFVLFSSIPPFSFDPFVISVTDWVEHVTLAEKMERGMGTADKREIMKSLVAIVEAINRKKIVHRDLNPRNIIITDSGELKVMNFDYAKLKGSQTVVSALVGKADTYRALELIYYKPGAVIDYHADLYSLGVIFYELLCGKPLFRTWSDKLGLNRSSAKLDLSSFDGDPRRQGELNEALQLLLHEGYPQRDEGLRRLKKWLA